MRRWFALVLALLAAPAFGADLPVKTHSKIKAYRGNPQVVIARDKAGDVFSLHSAHKEARRPWVDVIVRRQSGSRVTFMSRAFDCRNNTVRWLGEAPNILDIPLSVPSIDYVKDRRVRRGSLDHAIGRFACGL